MVQPGPEMQSAHNEHEELAAYLRSAGLADREGSSSAGQQDYLRRLAAAASRVCEIGFSAGGSALAFLQANRYLQVTSFDVGAHDTVRPARDWLQSRYPGRLTVILGRSQQTVPACSWMPCDVVFIDGGHDYEDARADLANVLRFCAPGSDIVMDDIRPEVPHGVGPSRAWNEAVTAGVIRQVELVRDVTPGSRRVWARGRKA